MTGEQMENDMAKGNVQVSSMLTVREVSQLLHVHCGTLRRWTEQGVIKAYRIGPRGDRRFRPEDIAVLFLGQTKASASTQAKEPKFQIRGEVCRR
jgi:excisionase family DNA binding protein